MLQSVYLSPLKPRMISVKEVTPLKCEGSMFQSGICKPCPKSYKFCSKNMQSVNCMANACDIDMCLTILTDQNGTLVLCK
ncbi:unnamed protein product [Gordionus sp. m RMFG-2023]